MFKKISIWILCVTGILKTKTILGFPFWEPLTTRIFKNKFLKCSLIRGSLTLLIIASFACSKKLSVTESSTYKNDETKVAITSSLETSKVEISHDLRDLYSEKSLEIKSAKNVRQLGGYKTTDGKVVKDGLLLRGAHLARLSDEDAQVFKNKYNLKEIIDFRVAEERDPVMDKEIDGINNTWVLVTSAEPIMNRLENVCEDRDINMMATYYKYNGGIDSMYSHLVNDELAHEGYRKFFDILLSNDGATYWHCSGGKDRTGFASVLLLSLFGVDEKTILDDYEASIITKEQQMNDALKILTEKGYKTSDINEIVSLIGVKRAAMETALREIDSKYNGMNEYLHNQIGLSDDEIKILRDKYLVDAN